MKDGFSEMQRGCLICGLAPGGRGNPSGKGWKRVEKGGNGWKRVEKGRKGWKRVRLGFNSFWRQLIEIRKKKSYTRAGIPWRRRFCFGSIPDELLFVLQVP